MVVPWIFLVILIVAVLLVRSNASNPKIARFETILFLGIICCSASVGFIFMADVGIFIKLISLLLGWEYLRIVIFIKTRIG